MQDRDFKGVWIPKEIWLNHDLTLIEKVIFVEIDSLDNENNCTAGNEYFAEFCGCSESKVSKAIKRLQDLELIEVLSFDGRHRKIRVAKNARQSSKKCYADSQNLLANNIDNNTNNKILLSKDNNKTNSDFQFGKTKPKKDNLYSKCIAMIDDFLQDRLDADELRPLLVQYLNLRLEMSESTMYANQWKGLLNKLLKIWQENPDNEMCDIIQQSIDRGYKSFFPVSRNYYARRSESGVRNVPVMTEDDYSKQQQWIDDMESQGVRVRF